MKRDELRDKFNIIGLEMEGAGTNAVVPAAMIRGVCDYGDQKKNDQWQPHAAAKAAAYAKSVLAQLPPLEDAKAKEHGVPLMNTSNTVMPTRLKKSLLFDDVHGRMNAIFSPTETTAWLRQLDAYKSWFSQENLVSHDLLFIKGKPGSGKSTALKSAMMHAQDQKSISVASFYFNSKESRPSVGTLHRSTIGMLRSLVYQLAKNDTSVRTELIKLWSEKSQDTAEEEDQGMTAYQWHEADLQTFLERVFSSRLTRRTFIFIDALDECSTSDGDDDASQEARDVFSFFRSILAIAKNHGVILRICVSCRTFFTVGDGLCEVVLDQLNGEAIATYVKLRFENHGATVVEAKLESVTAEILSRASGIFLWVKLVMDLSLRYWDQGRTIDWIKDRFAWLPLDLEIIYKNILSTMNDSEEERRIAIRFFYWMIFSNRPLQLREWYAVVGLIQEVPPKSMKVWTESKEFPRNAGEAVAGSTLEKWIKRVSRGLVEVSQATETNAEEVESTQCATAGSATLHSGESRRVYLIHETVREFFHKTGFLILAPALRSTELAKIEGHTTIINNCIHYLHISELDRWAKRRQGLSSINYGGDWGIQEPDEYPLYASAASFNKLSDEAHKPGLPMAPFERETGHIEGLADLVLQRRLSIDHTSRIASWLSLAGEPAFGDHQSSSHRTISLPFRTRGTIMEDGPNEATRSAHAEELHSVESGFNTYANELYADNNSVNTSLETGAKSTRIEGDVFALLEYATSDIFVHASTEDLQCHDIRWLAETLLQAWDRIVLLRPDLRRNANFIGFCAEASSLNTLIIPSLESSHCKMTAAAVFILICLHRATRGLEDLVLRHIKSGRNSPRDASHIVYSGLINSLFVDPDIMRSIGMTKQILVNAWIICCERLQIRGLVTSDEAKATINQDCPNPLFEACRRKDFVLIEKLLDMGADPNLRDGNLETPIDCLCASVDEWSEQCLHVLSRLIKKITTPENLRPILPRPNSSRNPLHGISASKSPNLRAFNFLLAAGVDANGKDRQNNTPLHLLCQTVCRLHCDRDGWSSTPKYMEMGLIITALLRYGADVNSIDAQQRTPMHHLSSSGHFFPLITILILNGADLNLSDLSGQKPHFQLYTRCHLELHLRFLQHFSSLRSVDPSDLRDNNGNTLFSIHVFTACQPNVSEHQGNKYSSSLRRLLTHFKFDVNHISEAGIDAGVSPLSRICRTPWSTWAGPPPYLLELSALMLDFGADARITDNKGRTPLHWTASEAMFDIVKLLISKDRASVRDSDHEGNTPLHLAAKSWSNAEKRQKWLHPQRLECVKFLLTSRASAIVVNRMLQTPAQALYLPAQRWERDARRDLITILRDAEASQIRELLQRS
ncbi:unnamed protein product [Periconia digitata]|uniref:Nephrocystin 3-like N-terminal domain-containing protein n=1 Tax=Periconia digitata TaxID=1303443 RepID=A0A9W4XQN0_9PLEO|nr:unnamed protein product [Periconia digitata]